METTGCEQHASTRYQPHPPLALLGASFPCPSRGREHRVRTERLIVSNHCLEQLPALLDRGAVTVVADNIACTIEGVKTLERGRAPRVIMARPADLMAAPFRLISAGLGDLVAKSVSSLDWRLNAIVLGDFFCKLHCESR